jgi:hypothetical protein
MTKKKTVAKFIVPPLLGDKVDYGIGFVVVVPARQPMEPDGQV